MAYRVVLTDFIADDLQPEREVLGDLAEILPLNAKSIHDVESQLETADAIIAYHLLHWEQPALAKLKKCQVFARGGVGTDNVDLDSAKDLGIPVCNVPDYGTEEVADSAFAMLLSLTRGTNLYNRHWQRGLGPWNYSPAKPLTRLRGKVCGIVGFGRIGQAFALRAKSVGLDVVFFDPIVSDGTEKTFGVRRVDSLAELLKQSFVLSCHCPRTPETINLIDAKAIDAMPRGSYLVNTSRGEVVDTTAIAPAIRSGQLAGAGIDVFAIEPPKADDPLVAAWQNPEDPCHERVILTPHAAFYSEEGLRHIRVKTAESCRLAFTGKPLRNVVNR